MNESLRDKLDEIRRRTFSPPARTHAPTESLTPQSAQRDGGAPHTEVSASRGAGKISEVLGGQEVTCAAGACWRVARRFDESCPEHRFCNAVERGTLVDSAGEVLAWSADAGILLLDIETGGFSGTPVFLIGIVRIGAAPPTVEQFLARDYPEERAILAQFAELLAKHCTLATFNGKSFDMPFLTDRATLHRVPLRPADAHFDLLHAARRRWKPALPDCRLETLEQHILGRRRIGDIPGSDVPDLFHHFIKTGNAAPLRGVLEHNRRDLIACAELLERLAKNE